MLLLIVILIIVVFAFLNKSVTVKEGLRRGGRRGRRGHGGGGRRWGHGGHRGYGGYAYYNWPYYYDSWPYYYNTYNNCETISYAKYRDCLSQGKSDTLCADRLKQDMKWC